MIVRRHSVLLLLSFFFIAQAASAAAFTPGNLVIYRVGDGGAALSSASTAVFLDEYTPGGTLVQSIPMPTSTSGSSFPLTANGTSTTEGLMTRSTDGSYLILAGYGAAPGLAAVGSTSSATVPRVIGRVDANGGVNTTTALVDAATGSSPRGAVSTDGNALWITGGVGGVRYTTLGLTTSTQLSTTVTNLRAAGIFNNQLYISSASGGFQNVAAVGSGIPTTSGQTIAALPGVPTASGPSSLMFFFASANTFYLADDRAALSGGGVQKWTFNGTTWSLAGTAQLSSARGITGVVDGTTVTLYVTDGTALRKFTDTPATTWSTATPTLLASAGANKAFRGVAIAPNGGVTPQPTNPTGAGAANPGSVVAGNSTLLTVTVTPGSNPTSSGLIVSANLTSIGGSASQAFFDDGTNGDVVASDNVFSYSATVAASGGPKSLPFSISDAQSRTGSGNISLTVTQPGPLSVGGAANPSSLGAGSQTLLIATVTPGSSPISSGIAVQANLSSIGGSATQAFFDDGTNGDVTPGDNVFSYRATVAENVSAGSKSVGVTAADAQSRIATTSISITITPSTPISATAAATPSSVIPGSATLITATVTPGTNPASTSVLVTANLVGVGGSSSQTLFNDGTNGDATPNDNIYSYTASVPLATPFGSKSIGITVVDAQGRTASATTAVTVVQPADHVVISQLYGGGGNANATFNHDFVELYNPTPSTVDLTGWSVQYASAAGTSWQAQIIGGAIRPGEYYLISLGTNNNNVGAPLPAANVLGSINMSGTTGKVALSNGPEPLEGGCPIGPGVVDFIGFGGADCREGASNAPAPSNTTADFRRANGAVDTDVNGADFVVATPAPRRTAEIVEFGPIVVSVDPRSNNTIAPHDASITVIFSEAVVLDAGWHTVTCLQSGAHSDVTTAHTPDNMTWAVTPNAGFAPGEQCTVTVLRDHVHDIDSDDVGPNDDNLPADRTWSFTVSTGDPAPYSPDVHLTMGNPSNAVTDVLTPNNYLMMKPTYALSYNRDKGTPNWVSWHLENVWYGSLARIDTFRPDPQVPPDWYRVQGFDFAATGFDRGHMTPNADRDNQNRIPINQETYLMSNMVPQAPDNNQGPWANLENFLRSLTDTGNELYIVSGPAGVGGTGSNGAATTVAGGHVTVPSSTWKVVLVLPTGAGNDVARVTAATRSLAVNMPNIQGIRTVDWTTYITTVDAIEALTGYDFFANVPDAIENAIEAGTNGVNPPGTANQSVSTNEDSATTFTLSAVASNAGTLTYTIVAGPSHGTLVAGANGSETYTPAPDFNGTDSFTFNVSDGAHTSNTSTVTITVLEVNDPITASNDTRATDEDVTLAFPASDLTANDSTGPANESSQTLTVTSVTATAATHGSVTLNGALITYTPAANYNGPASFSYHVCDNGFTAGLADPKCADSTVVVAVNPVNDAPIALITSAPSTASEGNVVTVSGAGSDVDADTVALTWTVTKNGVPYATGAGTSITFTPDDNGTYVVTLHVADGQAAADASASINVSNIAPVIGSITGPTAPLQRGATATVVVHATDAGSQDTHSALFAWDDATTSSVACTAGVCSGTHAFGAAGVYTVAVTVTDDDGGSATTKFEYVIVIDASAGAVTGSGFVNIATGKAQFNLESKYKNNPAPTGNNQLVAAGVNFISTSQNWLVVSGNRAQFAGEGTVNSNAGYAYIVTIVDGKVSGDKIDRIRFRIWEKSTGTTVFDNAPGASDDIDLVNPQVLDGGNVTINK